MSKSALFVPFLCRFYSHNLKALSWRRREIRATASGLLFTKGLLRFKKHHAVTFEAAQADARRARR